MARSKIEVVITGDASSLEKAFGRAGKQASGFNRGLRTASLGAAAALGAMGLAAKAGFSEFMEGERVSAQTAAALHSTGGAAKVAQGDIESLAGALSRMSGVDDEVIQSGQNMLLTFTRIRNEVGAGNNIFDQATRATLNLSVAMGKDMSSSAILVGKALNDPIAGMSSLTRAGVQFTDQQKETIRSLVESGNSMGAQKLILKELETQFGGSAKAAGDTFSGQVNKAKNSLSEMAASIVAATVPALTSMTASVTKGTAFMREHETGTKVAIVTLAALAVGVLAVSAAMKVYAAGVVVARAAVAAWTAAQWLLNVALTANPIGLVIAAIAALAVGLVIAYKRSETFRNVVQGAMSVVQGAVSGAVAMFQSLYSAIAAIIGVAHAAASAIRSIPTPGSIAGSITGRIGGLIPGRASGGPVTGGSAYVVGERGPELFVPGQSGSIIPNGSGSRTQIIQLLLDRKIIAQVVRDENAAYARVNG